MKSPENDKLKNEHNRQFNNNKKWREAEEIQKPFGALVFVNAQGEPRHAMRICWN